MTINGMCIFVIDYNVSASHPIVLSGSHFLRNKLIILINIAWIIFLFSLNITLFLMNIYMNFRTDSKGSILQHGLDWLDWICLTTTCPSGHISRPTQVNVSQSCFHSLNNYSSLIILYTSGG